MHVRATIPLRHLLDFLVKHPELGGDPAALCDIITDDGTGLFLVSVTQPMAQALAEVAPRPTLCLHTDN